MRKLMKYIGGWLALLILSASAQISQPYEWSHSVDGDRLTVEVVVPEGTYLYEGRTTVKVNGETELLEKPEAHDHTDDLGTAAIFEGGQTHRWLFKTDGAAKSRVDIAYQGCGTVAGGGAVCYPPSSLILGDMAQLDAAPADEQHVEAGQLDDLLDQFETVRTDGGIKNVDEMLAFLSLDDGKEPAAAAGLLEGKGIVLIIALVLLGGLALNLTPCVLPMIPVNLAIIGAGSAAASKRQGFIRGGVYGLGIAVAYGGLGIFTVLTGSKFGTLNASPVFNFAIAIVFLVLTLAMFDVLNIDLSRFSSRMGGSADKKRGGLIPAFSMGVVAALLAGACVAPMVIAVLLQATTMYAAGNPAGLFLPLLLGIGMGLPWPIAGAGLAVLPKPGMWMIRVKHGFGVLIAIMALYYGYLGYELLGGHGADVSSEQEIARLEQELQQALDEDRPVFIDFWASWCKNCLTMNATTFKDEKVINRLHDFQEIRFQAEDPGHEQIKKLMDRYNLPGLPGYVVLVPNK